MAYNALINQDKLNTEMLATANAIRDKTGTNSKITWENNSGFANAINSINLVSNLKEFSTNLSGVKVSWLYLDGYTFEQFITPPFNPYGKLSGSSVITAGELQITNSKVHIKNQSMYQLDVSPTDKIEAKEYEISINYG